MNAQPKYTPKYPTLAELQAMTKQQVFDHVAKHLLAQGKPAKELPDSGACAYRGADNTACAVGALIPQAVYERWMEGKGVGYLIEECAGRQHAPEMTAFLNRHVDLLFSLQRVHDSSFPYTWPDRLANTARSHGLNADVLKEVAA